MIDGELRWSLVRESGQPVRYELPIGQRMVLGRAPDAPINIPPEDGAVSRYHAAVEASTLGVQLVDLESMNGVYVNELRQRAALLLARDRIRLGNTVFRVEMEVLRRSTPDATGEHSIRRVAPVPEWGGSTVKAIPYVCELCGEQGPVPAIDHAPWWIEVAWICVRCAEARRTEPSSWDIAMPERIGDFQLLRFLARGGMAAVFEARHVHGGMRAAVKVMLPERTLDPISAKRFLKEQRIASGLVHERIVRCFGAGTSDDGRLFVATEFLARGDAERLAVPRADVRAAVAVAADMFEALAHAHAKGFVHRDVKPSNVLLTAPGADGLPHGKLADFGLAKSFRDIGGSILTQDGEIGGSAAFVAPEQLLAFRDVGPSADVYAAAASLYFLLTGDVPVRLACRVEDATDPQLCLATLAEERVPVRERRPEVHPWLAEWIDLLVCRDHARRGHIGAHSVADMLRRYTQAF